MAALYGIERVLVEAKAVLVAGMVAKLAALVAEYADGITLPAPDTTTGYWCDVRLPDPADAADFGPLTQPTICIAPLEDSPLASDPNPSIADEYAVANDFVVAVVVRGDTQAQSGKRQMRYMRAVKELLAASASLTCGQCLWRGTDWRQRDLTPDEADYTLQGVVAAFVVITYEQA
jgi:hypothetical protein